MSSLVNTLFTFCIINAFTTTTHAFKNDEMNLIKSLWRDYDPRVRPTLNSSGAVHVLWRTLLLDVLEIDKKCTMTMDLFVEMSWQDVFLAWNPSDFGGIEYLHRPIHELWKPDVNLVFSVGHEDVVLGDRIATINSSGHVRWSPHLRLHALTHTDLTYFPYDRHKFHVSLVSWLPKSLQDFVVPEDDFGVKFFDVDIEWDVRAIHVRPKDFQNSDNVLAGVFYLLDVERRPTFYISFIVYPTIIIGVLSLLAFFLSHDQRLIFCAVLFLCLLVVLGILQSYLPIGMVKAPIIASILAYELFVLLLIFCCSIFVLVIRSKDPRRSRVPDVIRKIFLNKFLNLVCLLEGPPSPTLTTNNRREEPTVAYSQLSNEESTLPALELPSTNQEQRTEVESDLSKTINYLSKILDACSNHNNDTTNDWVRLASVLDRLLFVLISVLSATVIGILCHPPKDKF